jgi:hypothetical protein
MRHLDPASRSIYATTLAFLLFFAALKTQNKYLWAATVLCTVYALWEFSRCIFKMTPGLLLDNPYQGPGCQRCEERCLAEPLQPSRPIDGLTTSQANDRAYKVRNGTWVTIDQHGHVHTSIGGHIMGNGWIPFSQLPPEWQALKQCIPQ